MEFDESYVLLSIQRALLGIVIPELRAVSVVLEGNSKVLNVSFYYDCEITEEIYDLSSCAITEVIADFPPDYLLDIKENIIYLKYPNKILLKGTFAYFRKE